MIRAPVSSSDHPEPLLSLAVIPALHHKPREEFRLQPVPFETGLSDLTADLAAALPMISGILSHYRVTGRIWDRLAQAENAVVARHTALRSLPWRRIGDMLADISAPAGLLMADLRRAPPGVRRALWGAHAEGEGA